MFEEICLVCGKHLSDDGRAYCSDDCQNTDLSSPSISSSSSALSSPSIGYAAGGDVPPLMPSALGSALRNYAGRSGYYVSSSASSTSWSVLTDEEDEGAQHQYRTEHPFHDVTDPACELASKSATQFTHSALSYARRPSGTNNHSTVPNPLGRISSTGRGIPKSAPIHSHLSQYDDEAFSDISFSSDGLDLDHDLDEKQDRDYWAVESAKPIPTSKAKRTRNRASLPACFSLLKMASPSPASKGNKRSSPVSSAGNTVSRPSPPTPKVSLDASTISHATIVPSLPSVHATPRGRRRETDKSRSSRRSGHSSPSRERRVHTPNSPSALQFHHPNESEEFDWVAAAELPMPRRGRTALRRNSSPPPPPMTTTTTVFMGAEDPSQVLNAVRQVQEGGARTNDRSLSDSRSRPRTRPRGRTRVEELGGDVSLMDAPGYGTGRSGLIDRAAHAHAHGHAHSVRVPL
ncbi:unnamed protein product [Cyclocybe aegerita]|uniref:Uncharacterized protein n=1 Tax=Cyclocybe aegerita TaxID=1973307 RepID=A0A8S0W1B9_CYCAE|nr:unnamed protein product [Cyclocybe aegerita]